MSTDAIKSQLEELGHLLCAELEQARLTTIAPDCYKGKALPSLSLAIPKKEEGQQPPAVLSGAVTRLQEGGLYVRLVQRMHSPETNQVDEGDDHFTVAVNDPAKAVQLLRSSST